MNERLWITNIIRFIGITGMFYVVRHWFAFYHKYGHVHFNRTGIWKLVAEICLMFIGVYMLRGAPLLVKFISPKDDDKKNDPN